jgi:hypothetical protein
MLSTQIVRILSQHPVTSSYFKGVFARDELVHRKIQPRSLYVVNLDRRKQAGTHWILIAQISAHAPPVYFCPLALPVVHQEIYRFLLSNQAPYFRYNAVPIQAPRSRLCGKFVIYAAIQFARGKSIKGVRAPFLNKNLAVNDRIVQTLLSKDGYNPAFPF